MKDSNRRVDRNCHAVSRVKAIHWSIGAYLRAHLFPAILCVLTASSLAFRGCTPEQLCEILEIVECPVDELLVTPASATIAVGETIQLTATITRTDRAEETVTSLATWTPIDSRIATISSGGMVTGVAVGTTEMRASYLGRSDAATIIVSGDGNLEVIIQSN